MQRDMAEKPEADIATLVNEEIHQEFHFKLSHVEPIELACKDLSIWAPQKTGKLFKKFTDNKLILNSVSCTFKTGTATAILGSSGSGKTTLLNYLSSRMKDSKLKFNGKLFVNGVEVDGIQEVKHRTGYITQQDVVLAELTPKEQFMYDAKLSNVKNPEKRVDETITILSLESCADTKIGSDLKRGLSGGERKRTSIGMEFITDPSLLFLDEPTTGLDSKSALDIAKILQRLAQNKRTVITTLHSPSSEIISKFDKIICLCRGEIIFYGPPSQIGAYFERLGFTLPKLTNPADHLMTIIHPDHIRIDALSKGTDVEDDEVEAKFKERLDRFVHSCYNSLPSEEIKENQPVPLDEVKRKKHKPRKLANFWLVTKRCVQIYFRNPQSLRTKVIQTIGFAFFAIIILNTTTDYRNDTQRAIMDKGGVAFFLASTMAFSGLYASLYTFIPAKPIFRRESENKLYGAKTFYFSHALFEWPIQILLTLLFQLVVFWAINVKRTVSAFILYFILLNVIKFTAAGLCDLTALILNSVEVVNQMTSVVVIPLFLVSGFLVQVKSIVIYMVILSYFSFFRFGFEGAIQIEFGGGTGELWKRDCRAKSIYCTNQNIQACYVDYARFPNLERPPQCDYKTNYNFYQQNLTYAILILLAQSVFFRILALAMVYRFIHEKNIKSDPTPPGISEQIEQRSTMKRAPFILDMNQKPDLSKYPAGNPLTRRFRNPAVEKYSAAAIELRQQPFSYNTGNQMIGGSIRLQNPLMASFGYKAPTAQTALIQNPSTAMQHLTTGQQYGQYAHTEQPLNTGHDQLSERDHYGIGHPFQGQQAVQPPRSPYYLAQQEYNRPSLGSLERLPTSYQIHRQ